MWQNTSDMPLFGRSENWSNLLKTLRLAGRFSCNLKYITGRILFVVVFAAFLDFGSAVSLLGDDDASEHVRENES